jgi:hypothetical protein
LTLAPSATWPLSGSVAPATSFSSVDLPAPLTPMIAPALAAAHLEVEPLIDGAAAIGLVHALQADDVLARARRRLGNSNITTWRRLLGGSTRSILSSFFTRLCTCAAWEARALNRSMNFDLLGQHRLLALELRLLLLLGERALLLVEAVVARIGGERTAIDLDDLADDPVHELAVVRGHHQRALEAFEEISSQIRLSMSRWLLTARRAASRRAHQQDPGERHAHLPAARQLAHVAVHHLLAEAEAGQDFARPPVQRIAVELLETPCTSP